VGVWKPHGHGIWPFPAHPFSRFEMSDVLIHFCNKFLYVIDFLEEISCARMSKLRRCSFYYGIFSSPF
jgi:hypothetical protein